MPNEKLKEFNDRGLSEFRFLPYEEKEAGTNCG